MDAKLFLMTGCLAGIVSACMHEKSDSASDIQQAVHTLVLEDYKGDTLTARRDFLRADSAYTIKIQQVAQDSLMYGFARIEKALNLSLMQNDFRPLREEIAFYERVHSSSINGIEQWKQISDKATYYRKMFE